MLRWEMAAMPWDLPLPEAGSHLIGIDWDEQVFEMSGSGYKGLRQKDYPGS